MDKQLNPMQLKTVKQIIERKEEMEKEYYRKEDNEILKIELKYAKALKKSPRVWMVHTPSLEKLVDDLEKSLKEGLEEEAEYNKKYNIEQTCALSTRIDTLSKEIEVLNEEIGTFDDSSRSNNEWSLTVYSLIMAVKSFKPDNKKWLEILDEIEYYFSNEREKYGRKITKHKKAIYKIKCEIVKIEQKIIKREGKK